MARYKAPPEDIKLVRLGLGGLGVILFVLGTVALILIVLLIWRIFAGIIAFLGLLVFIGNWFTWLVNIIALRPFISKIRSILPSPSGGPIVFYVFYHYNPTGPVDRIRYYVNYIIKPALADACKCRVIPVRLNKGDAVQLWTRSAAKSTHFFFVLTNKFFENVIDAPFEEEMLRVANLARANRQGSAIFVEQSDRQEDLLNKSLAAISIYEDIRAGQPGAVKKKITGLVPYRYLLPSPVVTKNSGVLPQLPADAGTSKCIWEVPFENNPYFFDRSDDRYKLSSILGILAAGNTNILILYGMNGVGKTEIVRAYAFEYGPRNEDNEQDYQYHWVMWVDASIGLEHGCHKLNEQLYKNHPELPFPAAGNQLYSQELIKLRAWIGTYEETLPQGKKWLLVIDRCERQYSEFENARNILQGFERGHIIYTMREHPGPGYYVHRQVERMNDNDGFELLVHSSKKDLRSKEEQQHAREVVRELGGNPLVIANAGAYISNGMTFEGYLKKYRDERGKLLNDPLRNRQIGAGIDDSVATTFHLSFEEIERDKNGAEEILLLCAFLGLTRLPIEIVTSMPRGNGAASFSPLSDPLKGALEKLCNLSFIEDDQGKTIRLEKIVRDVIRAGFYPNVNNLPDKTKEWYRNASVHAVSTAFSQALNGEGKQDYLYLVKKSGYNPIEKSGFADLGSLYLPHISECCTRYIKEMIVDRSVTLSTVQLLYNAAMYLQSNPQHEKQYSLQARSIFEEALRLRRYKGTGLIDHRTYPSVPTCLNGMAEIYYEQFLNGNTSFLKVAEDYFRKALKMLARWQRQHRPSDPRNVDEATVLNNLGRVLDDKGKYEEARKVFWEALRMRSRTLFSGVTGLSKIALLLNQVAILNNLGGIYARFGDQEAERAEKAHDKDKHTVAEKIKRNALQHYRIARRLYDIALEKVLVEVNKVLAQEPASLLRAACDRQRRLYAIQLKVNEATLLVCRGDKDGYEMAEEMYLTANSELEGMIKQFQQEDGYIPPDICLQMAMQWNNLMELYRIQRQFEKVKRCYKEIYDYYADYTGRNEQENKPGNPLRFVIRDNIDELVACGKVLSRQEIEKYRDYRNNYLDVTNGKG